MHIRTAPEMDKPEIKQLVLGVGGFSWGLHLALEFA